MGIIQNSMKEDYYLKISTAMGPELDGQGKAATLEGAQRLGRIIG